VTAEEWERIKAIFEAAINLPQAERATYTQQACTGNPDMLAAVRDLVANHEDDGEWNGSARCADRHVFECGELVGGRLQIIRLIASGGMGEVYEAYDQRLQVRLALKTLRSDLTDDDDALARFRREVLVAREVGHENLCRVFDLIEHVPAGKQPVACLTMELLEGENLLFVLRRSRPMETSQALPLIAQIASGLSVLHRTGIVHRDLKPSNIMLIRSRDGAARVVVMDFGLAKPMNGEGLLFESRVDFQAGAPFFMAPELWDGGRPSIASDIYSFGLVIDEMVTRSRAFRGDSVAGLYFSKLREGPIAPSARADSLPAHWEGVILRCLDADPSRRYHQVSDVLRGLQDGAVGPLPAPSRTETLASRRVLGRRALFLGAMAIPVAGAATVTILALQPASASVVVFPIEDESAGGEFSYLCKGTTAELMRRLSQVNGVRVIPFYEPRSKAPASLKGRFSLSGLLQAFRGQIRLTVQLTDNDAGQLIWSDNFDRTRLDDPLTLQSDIARGAVEALIDRVIAPRNQERGGIDALFAVAARMRRTLAFQISGVPQAPTTSIAALEQYMRGRELLSDMSIPASLAAIRCLESATDEDPDFALAWAALAEARFVLMEYNYAPFPDLLARARVCAEQAVARGPNTPEAHLSMAAVQQMSWEWERADESYHRALELNPKLARAHRWYAGLVLQFGRFDETLKECHAALELDPWDYSAYPGYGLYYHCAGHYEEAIEILQRAVAAKNSLPARQNLGNLYAQLGSLSSGSTATRYFRNASEQASQVAEWESRNGTSRDGVRYSDRMWALYYSLSGNTSAARPYLDQLLSDMRAGSTSPVVVAWIYTAQRQYEQALTLLERAAEEKDRKLLYLKVHPLLAPLRGTDRFRALVRRMRL